MDYKEKYEHGLECIQEILSGAGDSIKTSILRKRLQPFFPELGESEDERIKKRIYNYINVTLDDNESAEKEKWLAWLEKLKDFDKQLENAYKTADEVQYKRGYDDGYLEGIANAKQELKKQAAIKDGNSIDPHFGKPIITDCGAKEKIQEKIIELSHKEDQGWSEEDEENIRLVLECFTVGQLGVAYCKVFDWLQSLKQRLS